MARGVNKRIVVGNIATDLTEALRYTGSGTAVLNFTVATNETFKDGAGEFQERTTFHRCVAWGKPAEIIAEHTSKGKRIYVEGRNQNSEYEKDGTVFKNDELVVQEFMFLDNKAAAADSDGSEDDDDLTF